MGRFARFLSVVPSLYKVLAFWLAASAAAWANAFAPEEKVEFNRDVRPILSNKCFKCHGFDAKERKADRRLDTAEGAQALLESVRAIVPGSLEESDAWARIVSHDPDEQMPPPKSGKHLSDAEKEVLKRWILQGAEYQPHWAYLAPRKPEIPQGEKPIDFLVQRRLQQVGLSPSPEADRTTLLRRLSFDLLGLPPTPQEVAAFQQDAAPDAYERAVERLLANPHYGERMAMPWLDVVRYADTIGYHSDTGRDVWPYRNYVIEAFNRNLPFDQFTVEQLAGDLLPHPGVDQLVASCFNRLLLSTEEGGAQARDYEARMLTDRVRAVGTVWLGATIGCAQCHDHKFDPITSKDFYTLGAFFADLKEPIIGKREPGKLLFQPGQEETFNALEEKVAAAQVQFDQPLPGLAQEAVAWITSAKVQKIDGEKTSAEFRALAALPAVFHTAEQRAEVLRKYRFITPRLEKEREAFVKVRGQRQRFEKSVPRCLVSIHTDTERTVRIFPRGNWEDESGPIVKAALPRFLPNAPAPSERPSTRLDLAQWLVSRENPLTARVFVNRLWKQFFGTGLSKVLDDLGNQGEPPLNPALLDYLASEFMDSGWDVKHIVREIVTSATYRQVSTATPELLTKDPDNRELARQSRWRMEAELVRDNALAVSGLLNPALGGPSVNPYQPEGYWENLNFPLREYPTSTGPDQYRRGLYTWWQRSYLHPSLLAFDAPTREECAAERNRSNIPQQALALLNDPTYVEAARVFAAHVLQLSPKAENASRLNWAFQQALQRDPRPEERATLEKLLAEQTAGYRRDAAACQALLAVGQAPQPVGLDAAELAGWTSVTRTILNLHEGLTRF